MRGVLAAVVAFSLAGAAGAQSRQQPTTPPSSGGGDGSGVQVDEAGLAIGALQWALKKKREADEKKRREEAARKEAEARAAAEREAAERDAAAATMAPIPDPQPPATRPDPEPATTARPYSPPKRAETPVATAPKPAPRPAPRPDPVEPPAPVAEAPAVEAPAPAVQAPPPPVIASPPPPAAEPPPEPVKVGSPMWVLLGAGLAALLALIAAAVVGARQFLGMGLPPISVSAAADPGLVGEPDFGGLKGPQLSLHLDRGASAAELHYPDVALQDAR